MLRSLTADVGTGGDEEKSGGGGDGEGSDGREGSDGGGGVGEAAGVALLGRGLCDDFGAGLKKLVMLPFLDMSNPGQHIPVVFRAMCGCWLGGIPVSWRLDASS